MSTQLQSRRTLIVIPTKGCPRNCAYCYVPYGSRQETEIMSERVLEATFTQAAAHLGEHRVLWHGSEASLAGRKFFKRALALQVPGTVNLVQTNGYGDDQVYGLWADHNFRVGTSMDYPLRVNHLLRHETPDAAMLRMERLRRIFGEVGCISVISQHNVGLDVCSEMYESKPPTHLKFSPVSFGSPLAPTPEAYGEFLCFWIDRALEDPDYAAVEPVADMIRAVIVGQATGCLFKENCQDHFLAVHPQGEIYPCSRCLAGDQTSYGNVLLHGLSAVPGSNVGAAFRERAATLRAGPCANCEWFHLCHGGCPQEAGILAPDHHCVAYKRAFSHIRDVLTTHGILPPVANGPVASKAALRALPGFGKIISRAGEITWNRDCGFESQSNWVRNRPDDYSKYSESQYSEYSESSSSGSSSSSGEGGCGSIVAMIIAALILWLLNH